MPWRYGIVKYRHKLNPDFRFYGVGELYYDKDPLTPHSCTLNPVEPYAEHEEFLEEEDSVRADIKWVLETMLKDCAKYPIFDIDGPYSKSPWDGERSLDSLTNEQLQTMKDEEIENWLKAGKE